MIFESRRSSRHFTLSGAPESVAEHRARLAREQEETQQRRSEALASQVSMGNNPSERILIWERLHGLQLPCSPTHKLLEVIAAATDLQLEQVHEVQRLRVTRRSASGETAPVLPNS